MTEEDPVTPETKGKHPENRCHEDNQQTNVAVFIFYPYPIPNERNVAIQSYCEDVNTISRLFLFNSFFLLLTTEETLSTLEGLNANHRSQLAVLLVVVAVFGLETNRRQKREQNDMWIKQLLKLSESYYALDLVLS